MTSVWWKSKCTEQGIRLLQLICTVNQPCAWIQQLISAWINGKPKINLRSTTPAWLLVESTVWLNPTNQQLISAWINYQPGISCFSLITAWINRLVEWTRTAVDFPLESMINHKSTLFGWFNPIDSTALTFPTLFACCVCLCWTICSMHFLAYVCLLTEHFLLSFLLQFPFYSWSSCFCVAEQPNHMLLGYGHCVY